MVEKQYTRRRIVRSCAAASGFVALGSMAGCSGDGGNGNGNGGNGNGNGGNGNGNGGNGNGNGGNGNGGNGMGAPSVDASATIPADAETIVMMDFTGMVNDDNLRDVADKYLSVVSQAEGYDGPSSVDEALQTAPDMAGTDLDPNGLNQMLMFTKVTGENATEDYTGLVFTTSWSESDIVTAIENQDTDLNQQDYQGKTIYQSADSEEDGWFAVLEGGEFVIGTESAVKSAIDVNTGNADGLSGDLMTYYENDTQGYLRFASTIPEGSLDDMGESVQGIDDVQYVSGGFYTAGTNIGMTINMHTGTEDAATSLEQSIGGVIQLLAGQQENPDVQEILNAVETSAEGTTMSMTWEQSVSTINGYIEKYGQQLLQSGMGAASASRSAPAA